jgi:hypothetical protein
MKTNDKPKTERARGAKIKIKIGRIVAGARPVPSPGGGSRIQYPAIEALSKLGNDEMPLTERYAAGRTRAEYQEIAKEYEKRVEQLVEKHGRKQSVIQAEELADVSAALENKDLGGTELKVLEARRTKVRDLIVKLERDVKANPKADYSSILLRDVAAFEAYRAEVATVEDEEIDLKYLDHRIPLAQPDPEKGSKGSALTGDEMESIHEVIEVR